MMKRYALMLFILSNSFYLFAQTDNPVYQAQRSKINGLLENRSSKFGQYTESLSMHTGIFGLKTKKDMQRSIDILTDIVKTDNTILYETKVLLDYKDLEKTQVQSKATDNESRMNGYMLTITKLQQQNEKLNLRINALEREKEKYNYGIILLCIVIIILMGFILRKKKH